jgi:RNA polymerase sigma-B factor
MTGFPHAAWSMTEEPVMRVTAWIVPGPALGAGTAEEISRCPVQPVAAAPPLAGSAPEAEVPLVPVGRVRQDLGGLADGELLGMVRSLPRGDGRREAACAVLVGRHGGLVRSCARRYSRSAELTEELVQVGYVGLMKAISNFDPAIGGSLAAYAQPSITGEIKKHFRDKHWPVHVSRPAQELMLEARSASGQLAQDLGRAPAEADLARHLGVSGDALAQARRAELALRPGSLDAPASGVPGSVSLAEVLGQEDPRIEQMLAMRAVAAHWDELSPRERAILVMRYYGDMTQVEIGRELGLSQMHISRLLTHALGYLRPRVFG